MGRLKGTNECQETGCFWERKRKFLRKWAEVRKKGEEEDREDRRTAPKELFGEGNRM